MFLMADESDRKREEDKGILNNSDLFYVYIKFDPDVASAAVYLLVTL